MSKQRVLVSSMLVFALVAIAVSVAGGKPVHVPAGNLELEFDLGSAPKRLPAHQDAPISLWGSTQIRTKDGSPPPRLLHMEVQFDRFGHVETRGLPHCTRSRLSATTTPQARKLCPGAIVGKGFGKATIAFPEQAPIRAGAPLTFFNGPAVQGDPTVLVHVHLDVPAPTTYVVSMRIERIDRGVFGYRIDADIPPIAGGSGTVTDFSFTIDRDWNYHGGTLHYLSARCPIGRLQALFRAQFDNGTDLQGHFVDPCEAR
jgi:hypothetical protein